MRPSTSPSRLRGFTLLELLLAVAILSAVFGLVATMWGQASGWDADIEKQGDALRLQRVLAMMKDQWGDRRTGFSMGAEGAPVYITDRQISFSTGTPILFPQWPVVVATYRFEQETEPGRHGLWRIVYEESRVSSSKVDSGALDAGTGLAWDQGRDPRGRPVRDRVVLLDGLTEMRFERFGPSIEFDETVPERKRDEKKVEQRAGGTQGDPAASEQPEDGLTERERDRIRRQRAEAAETGEAPDPGLELSPTEKAAMKHTWRPMEEGGYPGIMPSIRMVGELDKERFACVFVVVASR